MLKSCNLFLLKIVKCLLNINLISTKLLDFIKKLATRIHPPKKDRKYNTISNIFTSLIIILQHSKPFLLGIQILQLLNIPLITFHLDVQLAFLYYQGYLL